MKAPRPGSLFDDDAARSDASLVVMRRVPRDKQRLTAEQRTFNRLIDRIRRRREALAAWEAYRPRFQARLQGELEPIEKAVLAAQRQLVLQLDGLLGENTTRARLTKRHRTKLRAVLLEVAGAILHAGPDAEIEAAYDRYADVPYSVERDERMRLEREMFGDSPGRADYGDDAARGEEESNQGRKRKQQSRRDDEQRSRGRRSRAGSTENGRDESSVQTGAARQAAQSVREIYRKLVSALHPDREADPAERARKTELMQRANEAWKRNDLLELLALQIETAQIDADSLAELPHERLRHYNQALQEQLRRLEGQLLELTMALRFDFGLAGPTVEPRDVDDALTAQIAEARATMKRIERLSKRLDDPAQRRAAIDELDEPEDDPELWEMLALADAFDSEWKPERQSRRRRR